MTIFEQIAYIWSMRGMMKPRYDYFYRFPHGNIGMPGRCRVRVYKRGNGAHTVLLTELNSNAGESIASACERIATDLAATKGLNPKTTRWIQHEPPDDDLPHEFDALQFDWDGNGIAHAPQWQPLSDEDAATLTGDSLDALNRRLGDLDPREEEEAKS